MLLVFLDRLFPVGKCGNKFERLGLDLLLGVTIEALVLCLYFGLFLYLCSIDLDLIGVVARIMQSLTHSGSMLTASVRRLEGTGISAVFCAMYSVDLNVLLEGVVGAVCCLPLFM